MGESLLSEQGLGGKILSGLTKRYKESDISLVYLLCAVSVWISEQFSVETCKFVSRPIPKSAASAPMVPLNPFSTLDSRAWGPPRAGLTSWDHERDGFFCPVQIVETAPLSLGLRTGSLR